MKGKGALTVIIVILAAIIIYVMVNRLLFS